MASQGRAARRLAALAAPLEPKKAPYYVRLPVPPGLRKAFPAEGWYWVPKSHDFAVYLGNSFESAVLELHRLLADLEAA